MTAHWEHQLQGIAEKTQAYKPFMAGLEQRLATLMLGVKANPVPTSLQGLPQVERAKSRRKPRFTRKKK
jgi:DNA topoisomerase-3